VGKQHVAAGDIFPEEICYWGGICYQRGHIKKVSSQRRYLAKGGI